MRISDWSSDVCSSDLLRYTPRHGRHRDAAILALAPPPAKAGGGWEGVVTVRTDPKAPLPNPPLPSQGRELCRSDADLFPQTAPLVAFLARRGAGRSEEHTSELQSLMRNSYAVFCLKKPIHFMTQTTRSTYGPNFTYYLHRLYR